MILAIAITLPHIHQITLPYYNKKMLECIRAATKQLTLTHLRG